MSNMTKTKTKRSPYRLRKRFSLTAEKKLLKMCMQTFFETFQPHSGEKT